MRPPPASHPRPLRAKRIVLGLALTAMLILSCNAPPQIAALIGRGLV